MATDITAARRTERDLRDAVQRMRQAERTAHVGHWRHDVRTGEFEPSDELLRIVGAPPGAAGEDVEKYVHPDDRARRRRLFEQVLAGKPYTGHEWRAIRPDGAVRYLSGSAEPVFDGAGNVVAVFGVTQDVTERAEALQAARESSEQYRALVENMLEGFAYCRMVYDAEGRPDDFVYLSVNPAFYRLTGLTDAVGKRVTELIPTIKESTPELLEVYGRVAATGEPAEFDIDFTPIDRWLHVSASRPREGEFVAFFTDVTERKKAELDLQESEERFRSLFELSPLAVFFGRPDGGITAANSVACKMLGYTEEQFVAAGRFGVLDPDDPRLGPALEDRSRTGRVQGVELTAVRKGGERFPVEVDSILVGTDPPHSFVMMRDITERKRMEEDLRRSEAEARETVARLSRAQALGRMGDWEWDVDSGEVRWSEEIYRIYGVPAEFETTFATITAMTHPDDGDRNLRQAQAIIDDPDRFCRGAEVPHRAP